MSANPKYTEEYVRKALRNKNFKLVSGEIYTNTTTPIVIVDSCGYLYKVVFSTLIARMSEEKWNLEKFSEKNPFTIENIKKWLYNNQTELELVSSEYPKSRRKILCFKCKKCNKVFSRRWDMMKQIGHCVYCYQEDISDDRSFVKKFPKIAEEWNYEKNRNIDINKVCYASNKKYWWTCKNCGNDFYRPLAPRTLRSVGCPICCMSGSVKKIYDILKENNIPFDIECCFDDLLSDFGNPLRYDFGIFEESKNILCLIEYDDMQHEEFIPYFHQTEAGFNYAMRKDEMKNLYAKSHNIPLLRITYRDKENIKDILLNFIQNCL